MIRHEGNVWILRSHKGRVLGVHATKAAAISQEVAIHLSQARRAGHKIPRPSR